MDDVMNTLLWAIQSKRTWILCFLFHQSN